MMEYSIIPAGDKAVKVWFHDDVSPGLNTTIQRFCDRLEAINIAGVTELVPAFDSVTIYYDPTIILYEDLHREISEIYETPVKNGNYEARLIHVPVVYGGEYGPDLQRVADHNNLATDEVIKRHQAREYLIYMIGFLPGFPYLGGLDTTIATPRLENPRASTFAGAVGIAHEQTGIYPVESPGGWNIIGKTPLHLVDLEADSGSFLFKAGDFIRFFEVSEKEFQEIEKQVNEGTYQLDISKKEVEEDVG
ncbi:5-oxoprolinase subunit PxpB [Oceanobacillus halotolerans]|uniref:5-oxoprolinase subunit PxpB n=1 Tax=Oceanobacillus halotolerans TaxID=2663380 RepID=UPI0013DC5531|nr:5-oxoprolinase subunit PxpB [Oceanobacillus halotolerans]